MDRILDIALAQLDQGNATPSNASRKILADFEETLNDLKKIAK
jgi:hypothetical protein